MKTIIKYNLLAFAALILTAGAVQAQGFYNIRDYGAKGDGKTIDSPAVNKAIEAASANGGGTVFFPAGTYACYSIRLKNNITLYLDNGSVILAAQPTDKQGYDVAEPNEHNKYQDFGHSHWQNSLIWGIGLENITICGQGRIYGYGLTREESRIGGVGNKAVSLKDCKNVTIKDISMLMCGHFALLATGVDNMTLDNIIVDTNRDGFDIDCCRNVRVSNCTVNSPWDDGIVLKASYALGRFKDTENVTITNCFVSGFDRGSVLSATYEGYEVQVPDQGFATGRIKFGTESSGGFKNITISNCVFEHCRGLALESVDGGHLEDVSVTNVTMKDIVNSPIFLRLGSRMRSPEGTPVGEMRRILIDNLVVYNADERFGSIISGIPGHNIEDVTISNVKVYFKGEGTAEMAKIVPPENEKKYPDPGMFGEMPSYGFFVRHAENIEFNNISLYYDKTEMRPPFVLDDVKDVRVNYVRAQKEDGVPMFVLKNVKNFETTATQYLGDLKVEVAENASY